jgi:hypothetical protein
MTQAIPIQLSVAQPRKQLFFYIGGCPVITSLKSILFLYTNLGILFMK